MSYQLDTCVWEITMGCNYRCRHCGSACSDPLPDELTTAEALSLAEQIGGLKPRYLSITGGEPLMRRDWPVIVKKLADNNIIVSMITNGAYIDENTVREMQSAGLALVSISMDGTRDIHNFIRGIDCYGQSQQAYRLLRNAGIVSGANTTIVRENIENLQELRDELVKFGVSRWQLQVGLPVGNLKENSKSVIEPEELEWLLDFVYEENQKGDIDVMLAESVGYYSRKDAISKQRTGGYLKPPVWKGCNAGIRSVGILQNGDVTACTSIRDPRFIEGNIKERSLNDIWNDENSFAWRRKMRPDKQEGFCHDCRYAALCLGGCTNAKLTLGGSIYAENRYCVYYQACHAGETMECKSV